LSGSPSKPPYMGDATPWEGSAPRCPSCKSAASERFFQARGIPVDSCGLLATREEALAAPSGDLALTFCRECGFIWNSAYDPRRVDHSLVYEDQQCFSPTFNAFAEELADDLIGRYDLGGDEILEIGCGKGDFLRLLCERSGSRGLGIDPAYVERPAAGGARADVRFIRDYFSQKHSDIVGDLVCCRHTLEHLHNTGDFMEVLRRSIGGRSPHVFFEVPDVTRILEEAAFWDVYYYHCSYFSPGSLARLFRISRFEVTEVERAFEDQYLLLFAEPGGEGTGAAHPLEETVEEVHGAVGRFRDRSRREIDGWRRRLGDLRNSGRRVVAWGSGSKCVTFLSTLGVTDELEYVVDINPYRHGRYLPGTGKEVVRPEFVAEYDPDVTIVMNPIYCEEIGRTIREMGVETEIIPAYAAE
jgi:SAM-dependent methyltransferase